MMLSLFLFWMPFFTAKCQFISEIESYFRCSAQNALNYVLKMQAHNPAHSSHCNNPSFTIKFDAVVTFTIIIKFDCLPTGWIVKARFLFCCRKIASCKGKIPFDPLFSRFAPWKHHSIIINDGMHFRKKSKQNPLWYNRFRDKKCIAQYFSHFKIRCKDSTNLKKDGETSWNIEQEKWLFD